MALARPFPPLADAAALHLCRRVHLTLADFQPHFKDEQHAKAAFICLAGLPASANDDDLAGVKLTYHVSPARMLQRIASSAAANRTLT